MNDLPDSGFIRIEWSKPKWWQIFKRIHRWIWPMETWAYRQARGDVQMSDHPPKPMLYFANDPNGGTYQPGPRRKGEVRKSHQEYWDAKLKGWGSAVFVEDDDGMRWINEETGEVFPVEGERPLVFSYASHPPWEKADYE